MLPLVGPRHPNAFYRASWAPSLSKSAGHEAPLGGAVKQECNRRHAPGCVVCYLGAMGLEELAGKLSDRKHIGLDEDLAKRLGMGSEDVTRGRLMAQIEGGFHHLGVYLLACYVVDDTDFWGDGEIYWWSVPAIVDVDGKATKDPLCGLPNGDKPHKVGSLEWMTNISLAEPPLLAVIPPGDAVGSCVIRLAFYDDDRLPADVPAAMRAGLEAYAALPADTQPGPEHIIMPVRDAIWKSLVADQDDILLDQDLVIRHGTINRFGGGMVGSVLSNMARVYYLIADEQKTERFGPITLRKGQTEVIKFNQPLRGGGMLAMFARGADASCPAFGDLTSDTPFFNRMIESRNESALGDGFTVTGKGPAKLVAYYTPG
jgi:hypothetical protein